ncbi:hypothetical protein [Pseudoflavonifractor sp. 60]|uniref:hypothetical protein n=1 Tax=Pseudoflavonifractor sp. 60 TaxID=2304576 RepID=UPI001FADA20A|nr:hypothetical protein [Pseudoflavonifractor sp. 60]
MSNYVQLDVWFQEDKLSALSSVLVEQGTTVEKRMQGVLLDMYEALVPRETQEAIRTRLDKEEAKARAAEEAARKYTAFCVRENGERSFFQLDRTEDILEIAKFLRRYLREEQGPGIAALQTSAFAGMEPVTAEQYDQLLALRIETPDKITGAFDLDFAPWMLTAGRPGPCRMSPPPSITRTVRAISGRNSICPGSWKSWRAKNSPRRVTSPRGISPSRRRSPR